MTTKDFSQFEKQTNITFVDKKLLTQAFTHRSFLNEYRDEKINHNERLEFLGDAVLELAVTNFLFKQYPKHPEGDLTAFRSALVNTVMLSKVASTLNMNDYLLLSRGEAKDTGRARQYILADTLEAFIGALYLDQGYSAAEKFIAINLFPLTKEIVEKNLWQDSKSSFQEAAQDKVGVTPSYITLKEIGPDHDKRFVVGVYLQKELIAEGEGNSKQEAEQQAAEKALLRKNW